MFLEIVCHGSQQYLCNLFRGGKPGVYAHSTYVCIYFEHHILNIVVVMPMKLRKHKEDRLTVNANIFLD